MVDRAAGIVCDAKSGVSGAGRKPSLKTSFCEVTGNFSAYSILHHRHVPEVLQISGLEEREFSFTAQLLPLDRGILETIYFRAAGQAASRRFWKSTRSATPASPSCASTSPAICRICARWQRTNFCDIGVKLDPATGRAVVVSAIDNLVKGAAGPSRAEHEPGARVSRRPRALL